MKGAKLKTGLGRSAELRPGLLRLDFRFGSGILNFQEQWFD